MSEVQVVRASHGEKAETVGGDSSAAKVGQDGDRHGISWPQLWRR